MTKTGAITGMGSAKPFALCRKVPCKEEYPYPKMSLNFLLVLSPTSSKHSARLANLALSPSCVRLTNAAIPRAGLFVFALALLKFTFNL